MSIIFDEQYVKSNFTCNELSRVPFFNLIALNFFLSIYMLNDSTFPYKITDLKFRDRQHKLGFCRPA